MFSIQIDTSQDVSIKEQCSVIVRYVYEGDIHERIFAMKTCNDTTGKGLCNLIENIFKKYEIDMSKCVSCSTDGASNMRGEYNGFRTWLERITKFQIYVWCYSHKLNLILKDITSETIKSISLFGLITEIINFLREGYKRMTVLRQYTTTVISAIGNTRWWSTDAALRKIFGNYGDPDTSIFYEISLTLNHIKMILLFQHMLVLKLKIY